MKKPKPAVPEHRPWHPVHWDERVAYALQAMNRGEADPHQQKLVLNWLINTACGTYSPTHFPDPRDTDFANGMRHVGLQTVKIINLPPDKLKPGNRPLPVEADGGPNEDSTA